jgi:RhtB (resistance to homoserine/threonine) family protein
MDILLNALILVGIYGVCVISPGPDLVVAIRNSIAHGRMIGIYTALGFGLSVAVHVTYTSLGLAALVAKSVIIFSIIKVIGVVYLLYMGIKAIRSQGTTEKNFTPSKGTNLLTPNKAFWQGFITNLFNPKATLFFLALFSQFINPTDTYLVYILYGSICVSLVVIWFSLVSIFLTIPKISSGFFGISKWVDRVCGILFIALGIKLALSKAPS